MAYYLIQKFDNEWLPISWEGTFFYVHEDGSLNGVRTYPTTKEAVKALHDARDNSFSSQIRIASIEPRKITVRS